MGYNNKIVCYGCLLSPKVVGRVANPIGAQVGDMVKVHISAGKLYTAAGMFYLLPVFTLLLGAFIGIYVSETFGVSENISTGSYGIKNVLTESVYGVLSEKTYLWVNPKCQGTATGNVRKGRKILSPEDRFSQTGPHLFKILKALNMLSEQNYTFEKVYGRTYNGSSD